MKTALTKFIELLKLYEVQLPEKVKEQSILLLEKEKEQIIDAMERTAMYVSAASLDKEIGKMTFEDLYNQTYNK